MFRLNATEFPQSGDVWDSLGEAYLAKSNRVMARVCYQKSLELEPDNGNAIAQLQKLEAGASKP